MPRTARKRQTRLSFDPLPPSSPAPAGLSPSVRDRAAAVVHDGANPAKRRKVRDAPGASLASRLASEARVNKESLPPTPDPTGQISFDASVVSDGDGVDDLPPTKRLSGRKNQMKQKELGLTPVSPRSSKAINSSRPVKAGFFGTQQPRQNTLDFSDSDSLPELSTVKPKNKQKKKDKRRSRPSPSSQEQEQEQEQEQPTGTVNEVINIEDESEVDEMPTTPAVKRQASKRKRQASSSPLPPLDDSDDSDDVVITGSRKRSISAKKVAPQPSDSEQEESEEELLSRSRKRLRRGNNKSSQMSTITEEERQDLEDDLMDLASSGSDTEVRLRKKNKTTKKSAREEALEQLKRRRGGTTTIEEEDQEEEEEEEEDELLGRPDDGEDDYPSGSEEEDEEDQYPQPRTTRKQMFSKDEDDEGFVIDDDDGPLGAPSSIPDGVPIAFTRYASMKARDLFKFAIEWMVQKKINPAFQIDDEIYTLTFKKLDDEVKGLAGSKFKSAAWTAKFTLALEARPDIISVPLDRRAGDNFLRDKCDACNRSGHPATYEVYFQGKPYHKETLEPVGPTKESGAGLDSDDDPDDNDDSDSDSSESENAAANYDSAGRRILPEDTVFYLGKFCMSNAQTAHSLQHWRYHLYEWVVEYLESAGWNRPEMIVKRDKWSTRKRRKHANKIVDLMEQEGKIKALYKDFKLEIDTARNAKQGRWDSSP